MTTTHTTPVHPGAELWAEWLSPMHLTVSATADALGVSRKTMSAIVNGHQGISADMSVRLGQALGTAPDAWALKQLAFDLATTDRRRLRIKRLAPVHVPAKGGAR